MHVVRRLLPWIASATVAAALAVSVKVAPAQEDPLALIGVWNIEADGEPAEAVLRIDAVEIMIIRGCGVVDGDWDAVGDLFVAEFYGWSGSCTPLIPAWADRAATHEPVGDGHVLRDEAGTVVARLTPGRVKRVPDGVSDSIAQPPVVPPDTAAALPSALPEHLTPATRQRLLGSWVPRSAPSRSAAYVRFTADGSWVGSDGCNDSGGAGEPMTGARSSRRVVRPP